ncbi:hypothetical protein HPB52_023339 [Rhipicephalus sanguineus]|uniref:Uncharacterized protein n=1 Tax=Rhipicephalus sanguineus TaxID=34632 RepID=A0A9D4T6K9_RHISA|nr:hypothetical protein HPB52_023339 [Rhipicephalus sanguineus]
MSVTVSKREQANDRSAIPTTSGLQVLKPSRPRNPKKAPNYRDGETADSESLSSITQLTAPREDTRESGEASTTTDTDTENSAISEPDASSGQSSNDTSSAPRSSGEEKETPKSQSSQDGGETEPRGEQGDGKGGQLDANNADAHIDNRPIVSSGRYIVPDHEYSLTCKRADATAKPLEARTSDSAGPPASTSQPGLERRCRSRSRKRSDSKRDDTATDRAASTEFNLRRSKTNEPSSDSDAVSRAKTKKARIGSLGEGKPPPADTEMEH